MSEVLPDEESGLSRVWRLAREASERRHIERWAAYERATRFPALPPLEVVEVRVTEDGDGADMERADRDPGFERDEGVDQPRSVDPDELHNGMVSPADLVNRSTEIHPDDLERQRAEDIRAFAHAVGAHESVANEMIAAGLTVEQAMKRLDPDARIFGKD